MTQIRAGTSDGVYVFSGQRPLGVIWDVDPGSFHVLVYEDGLLGIPAPFWSRVRFALRYVRSRAPVTFSADNVGATGEERRIGDLVFAAQPSDLATQVDGAFFIATRQILQARLRYRVAFSGLDLTTVETERRRFRWTPSVNPLAPVREILSAALGSRLTE